jgi:hypothetical protein
MLDLQWALWACTGPWVMLDLKWALWTALAELQ